MLKKSPNHVERRQGPKHRAGDNGEGAPDGVLRMKSVTRGTIHAMLKYRGPAKPRMVLDSTQPEE